MHNRSMNILLLCSFESTYVTQLWENVKRYCPEARLSLLTSERARESYMQKLVLEEGESIYAYTSSSIKFWLKTERIIRRLPEFDIIHSLWMEKAWGYHAKSLKSKARFWLCSVGGSDLYRDSKKRLCKAYQLNILNQSDWFSSENIETREEFIRTYGKKYAAMPHTINKFGVDIFDALINRKGINDKKNKILSIPLDKIVVCCGYNANPAHQHLEMIQSFSRMPQEVVKKLFFIFPMTYGIPSQIYMDKVKEAISQITDEFVILEKFMDTDEMSEVVEATDIMIHVQTTDQMSSTMLAHMYNENVVIAGAWLPYTSLMERGIYFVSIDEVNAIDKVLLDILQNYENYKRKCEGNADLVYSMSSWNTCAKEWIAVYDKLMKGE